MGWLAKIRQGLEVSKINPNEENQDENFESPSQSEEEVVPEEEKKPSAAEERINQLVGKIKEFEEKLEAAKQQPVVPANNESNITPEMQKAVDYLKSLEFVRLDDVKKIVAEETGKVRDRFALDTEHMRLVNTYSGSDGRPKYDQEEVEKFMRERAIYDPQVAYEQLHKTELFDWEMKQHEEQSKKQPYVEKKGSTTATREENTITREQIADWMKTPEGRLKYEKNRTKILSLVQQGQL